jgi:DNA-binding transcriptional regulator YhcF (GntR family)
VKKHSLFPYLSIDYQSSTPKYLQLANSIVKAIGEGKVTKDEILPSINELSFEFEISRDTAEKGYKHLKKIGVLGSVPGKGFYVKSSEVNQTFKIFLLFNKLSAHKKIIYDSFVAALGELASVDFYIYNNDFAFFKKLLQHKKGDYTHYVIIPHFIEGGDLAPEIINGIDKNKLILLDKKIQGVEGSFAAVYQNFERDIYNALEQALKPLSI